MALGRYKRLDLGGLYEQVAEISAEKDTSSVLHPSSRRQSSVELNPTLIDAIARLLNHHAYSRCPSHSAS